MSDPSDFKRTMATALSTIEQLKRNGLSPYPRHYELMYMYSAGTNPALNKSVDAILKLRGTITAQELQEIFDEHISQGRIGEKIEAISDKIGYQIDNTMSLLSETAASTKDFSAALTRSRSDLRQSGSADDVGNIVHRLTEATSKADSVNQRLAQQLAEARQHIADLQQNLETVRYESLTDDLTTLANRKHFDNSINRATREALATGDSFSLLMVDIDHFKRFNDTYGHQTGDQVLRLVALSMKQTIKGKDIACRYGGEEFAIILPNTDLIPANIVAEQIRNAVMTKELVKRSTGENLGRITISLGVSSWHEGDTPAEIIARADKALYAAKRGGRNTVRSENDPDVINSEKVA